MCHSLKAPGFCCRVPGNAEGGLGHLQVSAFIGIYFGLLCLRQTPIRIVSVGFLALSKLVRAHQKELSVLCIDLGMSRPAMITATKSLGVHQVRPVLSGWIPNIVKRFFSMAFGAQKLTLLKLRLKPINSPGPDPMIDLLARISVIELKSITAPATRTLATMQRNVLRTSIC
jgi:hypothetical protein